MAGTNFRWRWQPSHLVCFVLAGGRGGLTLGRAESEKGAISVVPLGLDVAFWGYPALKRWAKIDRPSGALRSLRAKRFSEFRVSLDAGRCRAALGLDGRGRPSPQEP